MIRRQYSGNAHGLIKGIGMVNCLYVNPENGYYWSIDHRIFDPDGDGKTKLDHLLEMLKSVVDNKKLAFKTILFDSWYATKDVMLTIESMNKIYYCPLKCNRLVDDSGARAPYRRADTLDWSEEEVKNGKLVKIRGFPKEHKVKLFRVAVSNVRTEWIVTNDPSQISVEDAQEVCARRWKIEQFHRELKQITGVEKCQCRKARIQRNHIACAVIVWTKLTSFARKTSTNVYNVKKSLLSDYLCRELRSPSIQMAFA